MPRIIETTVYEIEELSAEAKDKARNWYRDTGLHDDWYDCVYEDFQTICEILGITLRTTPVRLHGGGVRQKPHILFRGYADNRIMPRSPLEALISPAAARALSAYSQGIEERQERVSGPVSAARRLDRLRPFQDFLL